jgi:hypothetical protein
MKKILVSTIVRNRRKFLPMWINQLNELCSLSKDSVFYLSVYENDSIDGSQDALKSLNFEGFKDISVNCENIHTPSFGSVKNDHRVQLLAEARNKSIYGNTFLEECDYVLSVEPDIAYSPKDMLPIIENDDYDILSARSIEYKTPPPTHLYDGWGTRNTEKHSDWEANVTFAGLIDTWTTYNCFCKYKANPIKDRVTFDGFNRRLNRYDCDTAVICENFREAGYSKIGLHGACNVLHMR